MYTGAFILLAATVEEGEMKGVGRLSFCSNTASCHQVLHAGL